ncbi:GGDEF domain-containing protein [Lujinxingia vulgaris]|uniref:GGDEF domain-containing protein n=1 Tax=Lujinxingia vulgaris TaxID=2600176 RepID=A0A5C6X7C8_9DELT|nr:GGDEF domain-containing protein [Lujinxingia vulgaris]TXD37204.1 GGDEF domain-containing protein [Lujinxingia vulgaris]
MASSTPTPARPRLAGLPLMALAMFAFLALMVAPRQTDAQPAPSIRVSANSNVSLARGVKVIADADAHYTPADLPELRRIAGDLPLHTGGTLPFEVGRHVLLFDVINTAPDPNVVLSFLLPTVQEVELIATPKLGGLPQHLRTGRTLHALDRPLPVVGHSLPLSLRPDEPYEIALFITARVPPHIHLGEIELQSRRTFNQHSLRLQITLLLSLGILLALTVHSLSIWARVREQVYLYFACYTFASAMLWLTHYELLRIFVMPDTDTSLLNLTANNAMVLFVLLFSREFLSLRLVSPRLARVFDAATLAVTLLLGVIPIASYTLVYHLQAGAAALALSLMALGVWRSWRAGVSAARIFLLAFSLLFIGASLTIADAIILDLPTATVRLATLASTALGMLAMAYSVAERMQQLQGRVSTAENVARTDSLTRLRNRSAFEEDIAAMLDAEQNPDVMVVFCDLDGLKSINDERGHKHGDELLFAFADELQQGFRDVDQIYRIGGDEFVLLLPNPGAPGERDWLENRVEHILERLRRRGFARADVSIGAAHLDEVEGDPMGALALADSRMYHAKNAKKSAAKDRARSLA